MSNEKTNTNLITQPTETITEQQWDLLQRQCKAFIASDFLPDHISAGVEPKVALARAVTIVTKGRELGLPPLQALNSINVIKGKPCLSAELMRALVYRKYPTARLENMTPPEDARRTCKILAQRPGGTAQYFEFSMDDAKNAHLLQKQSWQQYPQAMLLARATSAAVRAVFPDATMGCYTPEEMEDTPMMHCQTPKVVTSTASTEVFHSKPHVMPQERQITRCPDEIEPIDFATEPEVLPFEDKPITSQPPRSTTTNHGDYPRKHGWEERLATEKQVKCFWGKAKDAGLNRQEALDLIEGAFKESVIDEYGNVCPELMNGLQVSDVFATLDKIIEENETKKAGTEFGNCKPAGTQGLDGPNTRI